MRRLPSDLTKLTGYQLQRWRNAISSEVDILMEEMERIDEWAEGNKEKFGNDGIDYLTGRLMAA